MAEQEYFDESSLLNPPVKRAAYSDRTSWLMAEMARLAYFKFEGDKPLQEIAEDIIKKADKPENIIPILSKLVANGIETQTNAQQTLADHLEMAGFDLINTYNAHDTQAFLAKRKSDPHRDTMLVLAFRGTEAKLADIKTDLKAGLISVGNEAKVHQGFHGAFNSVKKLIQQDLDKHPDIPLYLTGHSLGGALAIVATRTLASDSVGACYTFGSPRVGNLKYADKIKTPIYRIVNAADIVPRLPFARLLNFIIALLRWLPIPFANYVADFLCRFRDYIHYGDMRYLTHVPDTTSEDGIAYSGLQLISNPSLAFTLSWLFKRWIATFGKAAALDHKIINYCEKLKAHARRRQ